MPRPFPNFLVGFALAGLLLLAMPPSEATAVFAGEETPSTAETPKAKEAKPAKGDAAAAENLAAKSSEKATLALEALSAEIAPSVAVVTYFGRDGKPEGLGTGFVVSEEGLIATNFHVIGEARPIQVEFADGRKFDVTAVEASNRLLDLALLRISVPRGKQHPKLKALPLGKAQSLKAGQPVAAFGNPRGLKHSVTAGVVSALREVEDRPMIQLAMPIEQGNSGGPLVNLAGEVVGVVNMKSLVTPNLGFAIQIELLRPMLEKPNPITMERWLTIGALDPQEWQPLFGARWSQRAGRIRVGEWGKGIGGRSICLWKGEQPKLPFDVAAVVRLEDEAGAAGLVFHSDGSNRHYGFYPSNGSMRLSRFDGPDVTDWKVLEEVRTRHYRAGEWNRLRVRLEAGHIRCYVNEKLVIESRDDEYAAGRVGLAKFRGTEAQFKRFHVGPDLSLPAPDADLSLRLREWTDAPAADAVADPDLLEKLVPLERPAVDLLRDQARELEERAERLRALASAVHREKVLRELAETMAQPEEKIDVCRAALLLSRLDNEELDVAAYEKQIARMAADVLSLVERGAEKDAAAAKNGEAKDSGKKTTKEKVEGKSLEEKLTALNEYLFRQRGFHGSRGDYYNRSNSYLNEVLDDREGLPITLSVIYLELGRRLELPLSGVGLPGHFIVRFDPPNGPRKLIDVFEEGKEMTLAQAAEKVEYNGGRFEDAMLAPAKKLEVVLRMLQNLLNARQREQDAQGMLPYLDAILMLKPDDAPRRWVRALVHYQAGRWKASLRDVDRLLGELPPGLTSDEVEKLKEVLEKNLAESAPAKPPIAEPAIEKPKDRDLDKDMPQGAK